MLQFQRYLRVSYLSDPQTKDMTDGGYSKNIGMLAFPLLTQFFWSPSARTKQRLAGRHVLEFKTCLRNWTPGPVRCLRSRNGSMRCELYPVLSNQRRPKKQQNDSAVMFKGWKWSTWELIWLSGTCWVILLFTLPETSSMTILYKRPRRLRKANGNQLLMSEADIEAEAKQKKDIVIGALWGPFQLTFTEPILLALDLYLGLVQALLYCVRHPPTTSLGFYSFFDTC